MGSCRSSGDDDLDIKLWATVEKDIAHGWALGPFFSEEDVTLALGVSDWVLSKRFPVVQGSKVRGVDDFSASLVNSAVSSSQKIIPGSADNVAALISFLVVHSAHKELAIPLSDGSVLRGVRHADFDEVESRRVVGTTLDLAAAYRQLAVAPDNLWASVLVAFNPYERKPAFIILRALPFGATASVEAFLRTSIAIRAVGQSLFKLAWESFFDDFPLVEFQALAPTSKLVAM
eukprot:6488476-Amphidinium_carterae.1